MKIIFFLILIITEVSAQDGRGVQNFIIAWQMREAMINGGKNQKPRDPVKECYKTFTTMKSSSVNNERKLMLSGVMENAFTREQIENMKNDNPQNIKREIRGNDLYAKLSFSYGGVPPSPHSRPGCIEAYQEEVKVIEVDGKKCRQIKFTQKENADVLYYQVYCQDSKNLYLSFDPDNQFSPEDVFPPKDCINCNK